MVVPGRLKGLESKSRPVFAACLSWVVPRVFGTSRTSKDGRADYLLVYDSGPRHYGAVAYVNAKNAGLTLRLTKDDVADITDPRVRTRDVQERNGYQVNCPVKSAETSELAVRLTQRALDKVRGTRN